jgi:WD40 repeat protein
MSAVVVAAALALNLAPPGLVAVIGTPAFRLGDPNHLLHISPDGKRLYTGYLWRNDNRVSVSVLDAGTGHVLSAYRPTARGEDILSHEFAADGLRLLILDERKETCRLRVVDPDTGRVLRGGASWTPPGGRNAPLTGLLHSAGVLVTTENTMRFLEPETGRATTFDPPLPSEVWSAHVSPDARVLVVQLKDRSVRIHDLPGGKLRDASPAGERRELVGFTPHGLGVAVWAGRGQSWALEVRDPDGKLLRTLLDKQPTNSRVVFDPTGKTFACEDGTRRRVDIYDTASGRFLTDLPGDANSAAYSPDGRTLWTVRGTASSLVPFDVATGRMRANGAYPPGSVYLYQFRADGRLVGLATSHVFTWEPRTGKELARVAAAPPFDWGHGVKFDPTGDRLQSLPYPDVDRKFWDYRTGAVTPAPALPKPPDGKGGMLNAWLQVEHDHVGFSDSEWTIRVLPGDKADGRPTPGVWRVRGPGGFSWPHLAPGGMRVVTVRTDRREDRGEVAVIDITDPKSKPARLAVQHNISGYVEPEFSPDGRWTAVAGQRMRKTETSEEPVPLVSVFDLTARKRAVEVVVPISRPAQCAFSPDGKWLAVGSEYQDVALVEVAGWKVRATVRPSRGTLTRLGWGANVRWSPDGKLFATTTLDERIAVWDVARLLAAPPQ